jgi:hypothetical protein
VNARIKTPRTPVVFAPNDFELERDALGLVLLGYPLPPDLQRDDFYGALHRVIFDASRELGNGASLPTIAALLRDQGHLLQFAPDRWSAPGKVSSAELYELMDAAEHSMRMGWSVDFGRLQELRRQRELLAAMQRARVLLEHDGTVSEASEILRKAI